MKIFTKATRLLGKTVALSALLLTTAVAGSQFFVADAGALRLQPEANVTAPAPVILVETAPNPGEVHSWNDILTRDQQAFYSSYMQHPDSNNPLLAYVNTGSSVLNLRSGPSTDYSILDRASTGALLNVSSGSNGWYKVARSGGDAYVSADYVVLLTQEEYNTYRNPGSTVDPSENPLGREIADHAKNFLGCPYVYGGNGPDVFDCSGLVKYVYNQFGYNLNRVASDQLQNGVPVEMSALQPGDLVFFRSPGTVQAASHVGLYIGDDQFIHASTNKYMVQIDKLSTGYYSTIYIAARHII